MKNHFAMFAAYNDWANDRIYAAAMELTDEEYNRDVSAFFRSMCGTLNHLLWADRVWMRRFTGIGEEMPAIFETILHRDLASLRVARQAEDRRICRYVDKLEAPDLIDYFSYTRVSSPEPITQRLAPALSHFFNHQTHHRGQAHTILSVLGKNPPPLDLLFFQRTEAAKSFA